MRTLKKSSLILLLISVMVMSGGMSTASHASPSSAAVFATETDCVESTSQSRSVTENITPASAGAGVIRIEAREKSRRECSPAARKAVSEQQKPADVQQPPCDPKSRRPDPRIIDDSLIGVFFPAEELDTPRMSAQEILNECIDFTLQGCVWNEFHREFVDPAVSLGGVEGRWVNQMQKRHEASIAWGGLHGKEDKPYYLIHYVTSPGCIDGIDQAFRVVSAENASSAGSLQQLAHRAVGRLDLPAPVPWVSVGVESGVPFTVVNGYTWFATHPEVFVPKTVRVQAGGSWVQVRATPVGLSLDPQLASEPLTSCAGSGVLAGFGPGGPWRSKPTGSDCWHRYQSSSPGGGSQRVRAVLSIEWKVTWSGSGNTSGSLPTMTTSAGASYAVTEAQALLNH